VHLQLRQKSKKCSLSFVMRFFRLIVPSGGKNRKPKGAKQPWIVAFTHGRVHLQLQKIFNVHLQLQCCIKDCL